MKATFNINKYIREAGRKLPLYETMYSESLFEIGEGYALVSRKKPNGDILFGIFLVDVYCLGVKDVIINLVTVDKYEDIKSEIESNVSEFVNATPNYLFNLIFGAVEYAEDMGLDPHKDFDLAEHILPKPEDIDFEDIAFGCKGRPYYIAGEYDKVSKILAILDKNVGKENYDFAISGDADDADDEDDEDSDHDDFLLHDIYNNLFPEEGEKETRTIKIMDNTQMLPKGEYGFLEQYCIDKTCDCRHVNIFVVSSEQKDIIATINYGWASTKYYQDWLGSDKDIENFKGPALKYEGIQSEYSEAALDAFLMVLKDQTYADRIKEHYVKVSRKIGRKGY